MESNLNLWHKDVSMVMKVMQRTYTSSDNSKHWKRKFRLRAARVCRDQSLRMLPAGLGCCCEEGTAHTFKEHRMLEGLSSDW